MNTSRRGRKRRLRLKRQQQNRGNSRLISMGQEGKSEEKVVLYYVVKFMLIAELLTKSGAFHFYVWEEEPATTKLEER